MKKISLSFVLVLLLTLQQFNIFSISSANEPYLISEQSDQNFGHSEEANVDEIVEQQVAPEKLSEQINFEPRTTLIQSVMIDRLNQGVRNSQVQQKVSDLLKDQRLSLTSPPIPKQITINDSGGEYNVFARTKEAQDGEGNFRYNLEVVDVSVSAPQNFKADIVIEAPSKSGPNYKFQIFTQRLKHIYKQKEPFVTVSFKIKTSYNHLFRQGNVSNWWGPSNVWLSQIQHIKIPTNQLKHAIDLRFHDSAYSPVRHIAQFPNGSQHIPVTPLEQFSVLNEASFRFIDEPSPMKLTEALVKDPELSYNVIFEKNNGNNTFASPVDVTSLEDWQAKINWEVLTNNTNNKALDQHDFSHKLTLNLHDQQYGHVGKETINLSLVNTRSPEINQSTDKPTDIVKELTYYRGAEISMQQILKDANITSKNINDSWFQTQELTHQFLAPYAIDQAGIIKLNQKIMPSKDPNLPGAGTESIKMLKLGKQELSNTRLTNPVNNIVNLPNITINVVEQPLLKVETYRNTQLNLGQNLNKNMHQFLKRVTIAGKTVPKSELKVELVNPNHVIGKQNGIQRPQFVRNNQVPITLKVTYTGEIPLISKKVTVASSITVRWGNAVGGYVGFAGFSMNTTVISLNNHQGILELVPTFGDILTYDHNYAQLRPNDRRNQTIISLYGKQKNDVVDIAFDRQNDGEPPIKAGHKLLILGDSQKSIKTFQKELSEKLHGVTPVIGDVLAFGNRSPAASRPNFHTKNNQKNNLPTKWAVDKESTHEWSRHKTDLFEITQSGLTPLVLNHFENKP